MAGGYANGKSATAKASAVFCVKCSKTRPGEAVFVVGGPDALGSWSTGMALPLTTSADSFPLWKSAPIPLPAGEAVEYKFLIQREDRGGAAQWQNFAGNYRMVPETDKVLEAVSDWEKATVEVSASKDVDVSSPLASRARAGSDAEKAAVKQEKENMLLKMAESGVDKAAAEVTSNCPLAVKMADREAMRRNFSQSLLALDADDEGEAEKAEADVETPVVQTVTVEEEEAPTRGVPLKHITSFSALTTMADAEMKAQHRKGKRTMESHYDPYNTNVPVVVVTSEVAPYSKTGGLGLVAASYAYEFARNGHRTMVVAPKYKHYDDINYVGETRVKVEDRDVVVKYFHLRKDYGEGKGTDFLFVEGDGIQRDGGLYNDNDGREYPDNLFRFTLLSLAAMEAPLILNLNGQGTYGDKVLFLANDWQAGLVPVYMCYKYRRHNVYTQARVLYVIHNLGYQGQYHGYNACRFFGVDDKAAADLSLGNCVNLSKGALICADRILTVSPNYSKEIQTPGGGFGLQDFVSAKAVCLRLAGILNGIDDCWDPLEDKHLFQNFSVEDFEEGKRANKVKLQESLGLKVDPDVCLIGFVGRLTWQKGIDVLAGIISWLMQDTGNGVTGNVQLIMMGNGDREYSETLRWAEDSYRGNICGYVGFDPKVEHQMMGGCDLFLMPSRYEPCGLPQMYAQAYGTLPIVHSTGGLVDSVKDVAAGIEVATGFHICHLGQDKMKETVYRAVEMNLKRPEDFKRMQRTAMQSDYYWPKAMDEYERQFDIALYECPTVR